MSDINIGYSWVSESLSYPLRKYAIKKTRYYCQDCGKEITYGAKRCKECSIKYSRKTNRPSREELKQLIRTTSFVQIGKLFGVTDNAIRKWCDGYNLPRKTSIIKKFSDKEWEQI